MEDEVESVNTHDLVDTHVERQDVATGGLENRPSGLKTMTREQMGEGRAVMHITVDDVDWCK